MQKINFREYLAVATALVIIRCAVKPRPSGRGYKARFSD